MRIGFCINCTCRIVQNQDFRFFKQRSCNTKALFLTAGYIVTALDNLCIVAVWKFLDKAVSLCQFTYILYFFVGCTFISPADIFKNSTGEKNIFL